MTVRNTPGYSGTPPAKKLGIKEAYEILLFQEPEDYESLVSPLPQNVQFVSQASTKIDLAHIFHTQCEALGTQLKLLRNELRPDAAIWVSWPKKSSKVPTTITEDTIRELALPVGFVDIKVCAVTEVWSGLKLVVRKELR